MGTDGFVVDAGAVFAIEIFEEEAIIEELVEDVFEAYARVVFNYDVVVGRAADGTSLVEVEGFAGFESCYGGREIYGIVERFDFLEFRRCFQHIGAGLFEFQQVWELSFEVGCVLVILNR